MIKWQDNDGQPGEGIFISTLFKNDGSDELFVYTENKSLKEYAQKCVDSLNSLSDDMVDEICRGIAESAAENAVEEEFEMPELDNIRDILNCCWFTAVYVNIPENEDKISYIVEGEGDWGEVVGFIIKDGKLAYTGVDYFDQ